VPYLAVGTPVHDVELLLELRRRRRRRHGSRTGRRNTGVSYPLGPAVLEEAVVKMVIRPTHEHVELAAIHPDAGRRARDATQAFRRPARNRVVPSVTNLAVGTPVNNVEHARAWRRMIEAHGLAADPPRGWDGEIYVRDSAPPISGGARTQSVVAPLPILHLASFPLPAPRGDYGGGAVELMREGDIFVALLEHTADEARTPLFARNRIPWPLRTDGFRPETMQRPLPGLWGHQSFFAHSSRGFCLYVVIGVGGDVNSTVRRANRALQGIRFT
jgi:hypothetical protein